MSRASAAPAILLSLFVTAGPLPAQGQDDVRFRSGLPPIHAKTVIVKLALVYQPSTNKRGSASRRGPTPAESRLCAFT